MKSFLSFFALVGFILISSPSLFAEEGHEGHSHERIGGPKGGRLLENTNPQAEFFVEKDNTVTVTFYDDSMKPVASADQSIKVIADANGEKTQLEFEKKDDVLVSKGALPEAEGLNLVVQFKQAVDAKPINFRFTLEKGICGECNRSEYACICEH